MKITLAWYEQAVAAEVAKMRHLRAIRRNVRPDGTTPTWDEEVEGASAEVAVAKALRIYWPGHVDNFTEPDLIGLGGEAIHVRWAIGEDGRCSLIVRRRDKPGFYILVYGRRGEYEIKGTISLENARRPEWLRNPHGWGEEWFVPPTALTPLKGQA